jgi:hypothetical protein
MNEKQVLQSVRIEPVRKQVRVGLPIEKAFELFTAGIASWWPLLSHSVGGDQAETCFIEGWVGGRIVEVLKDGSQSEWGRVLVWDPDRQVSFHFYPGRMPDTAQEVTVTFSGIADGTLVELVHTGWETLREDALARREGYETGWDYVLARFVIRAADAQVE